MAGIGRRTLYRKSVMESYLNEVPELEEGQLIAKVIASRGSNILEITASTGEESLAMLPTKFRKLIWVKRGDFVVVSGSSGDVTIATGQEGKVKYSIVHILSQDHIKELKKKGTWPGSFEVNSAPVSLAEGNAAVDEELESKSQSSITRIGADGEQEIENREEEEDGAGDEDNGSGSLDCGGSLGCGEGLYDFMNGSSNPNHHRQQNYYDDDEEEEEDDEEEDEDKEGGGDHI